MTISIMRPVTSTAEERSSGNPLKDKLYSTIQCMWHICTCPLIYSSFCLIRLLERLQIFLKPTVHSDILYSTVHSFWESCSVNVCFFYLRLNKAKIKGLYHKIWQTHFFRMRNNLLIDRKSYFFQRVSILRSQNSIFWGLTIQNFKNN